jgi:hypothetical protein
MTTTGSLFQLVLLASLASASGCTGEISGDESEPSSSDLSAEAAVNTVKTSFEYFVDKGLTKDQSAGIVGNLMQESGVSPTSIQYDGGPGRGIAQWSVGGRWDASHDDNVAWYASDHGLSRWSLDAQLDFIWFELSHDGYGYSKLKAATSVSDATVVFMADYEICGDCDSSKRIEYAEQALADYGK